MPEPSATFRGKRSTVPPAVTGTLLVVVGVTVWEIVAATGVLGHLTVARFSDVVMNFPSVVSSHAFLEGLAVTGYQIAVAVVCAQFAGLVLGWLMWRYELVSRALQPNLIGFGSFPGIVLYPALIGLFGITNTSVILIGFGAAVVPFSLGVEAALHQVPLVLRKLGTMYEMTPLKRAMTIVAPAALPHYFPSFRIGIMVGTLATIGSQFLAASSGLGFAISVAYERFYLEELYVYLTVIFLLSIALHMGLNRIETTLRRDMR